jgi:CubicO group peptidase (beta-lactamase class C family)
MVRALIVTGCLSACALSHGNLEKTELQKRLQKTLAEVAKNVSKEYNCSISLAMVMDNAQEIAAAEGITDFSTGRRAQVSDRYVWGSGTKPLTGASILKLVSEGAFDLHDPVTPLLDPLLEQMAAMDPRHNFSKLSDVWSASYVNHMTVHGLLHMSAGVPDFDTANPCYSDDCEATDLLRETLYAMPNTSLSPMQLMNLPWVRGQWVEGKSYSYSSTSYMLLGLLLASNSSSNATSWQDLNQGKFLPEHLHDRLRFATRSELPRDLTDVHGYDRTVYNLPNGSMRNDHDNSGVAGVFSGWTASDMVGDVSAVARLAWEIYREHSIAPSEYAVMMTNFSSTHKYGYATQIHRNHSGQVGAYGIEYGHFGATYGYQSFLMYYPELDIALAGASNMESDFESQVKAALCLAYNHVAAVLLQKQDMQCTFGCTDLGKCTCNCTSLEDVSNVTTTISPSPTFIAATPTPDSVVEPLFV